MTKEQSGSSSSSSEEEEEEESGADIRQLNSKLISYIDRVRVIQAVSGYQGALPLTDRSAEYSTLPGSPYAEQIGRDIPVAAAVRAGDRGLDRAAQPQSQREGEAKQERGGEYSIKLTK